MSRKPDPLAKLTYYSARQLADRAKDPAKGKPVGSYRLFAQERSVLVTYLGYFCFRLFDDNTITPLNLDARDYAGVSSRDARRVQTAAWRCFNLLYQRHRDGVTLTPRKDPSGEWLQWDKFLTKARELPRLTPDARVDIFTGELMAGGRPPVPRKTTKGVSVPPGMVKWKKALTSYTRSWKMLCRLGTTTQIADAMAKALTGYRPGPTAQQIPPAMDAQGLYDAVMSGEISPEVIRKLLATGHTHAYYYGRHLRELCYVGVSSLWQKRGVELAENELARVRRHLWADLKGIIENAE